MRRISALALIAVAMVAFVATSKADPDGSAADGDETTSTLSGDQKYPVGDDVKMTGCTNDAAKGPLATFEVTNHSEAASYYIIAVEFAAADGTQPTVAGIGGETKVEAGQTETAEMAATDPLTGAVTCKILWLNRNAVPGE